MTYASYPNQYFQEVDELSKIIDDCKTATVKTRKAAGEIGLFFTIPFTLTIGTFKLKRSHKGLELFLKSLLEEFPTLDERTQMKMEVALIDTCEALDKKVNPALKRLESTKYWGKSIFINEVRTIQYLLNTTSAKVTHIVYPNQIDPASDPVLFKKLVEAYEGMDLSDWKSSSESKYDQPLNKHAHV